MDQPENVPLIDQEALDTIRALRQDGKPDPLRRVLTTYLDSTGELLTSLSNAATAGDCETVRHCAHSAKSSSASVGALSLSEICRRLEFQAADNLVQGLEDLAGEALSEFERTAAALRLELDR